MRRWWYQVFLLSMLGILIVSVISFAVYASVQEQTPEQKIDALMEKYQENEDKLAAVHAVKENMLLDYIKGHLLEHKSYELQFQELAEQKWLQYSLNSLHQRRRELVRTPFADIEEDELQAFVFLYATIKKYTDRRLSLDLKYTHRYQLLKLSCEANTLTDMINYYHGKHKQAFVSERDIIAQIPMEEETFTRKKGKNYRGNPEEGFVGQMDGSALNPQYRNTKNRGRGVFPKPLLPIVNDYINPLGYEAYESTSLSENDIISSLVSGHPIMIRYVYGKDFVPMEINTPEQTQVTLYKNQHVGMIFAVRLDEFFRIKKVYFYDGLHTHYQSAKYRDLLRKTKYLNKFMFIKDLSQTQ